MYGQSDAATHEEYIERLDEPRRSEIRALHKLIRTTVPQLAPTVPQLAPTMAFGMPGYGKYHYRYATGREGDSAVVSLASNKNVLAQLLRVAAANPPGELAAKRARSPSSASARWAAGSRCACSRPATTSRSGTGPRPG